MSSKQYLIPAIQILVGTVLTLATGGATAGFLSALNKFGIASIIGGGIGLVASFITTPGDSSLDSSPMYRFGGALTNHRGEGEYIPINLGENLLTPLCVSTLLHIEGDTDMIERVYLLGWQMKIHNDSVATGGDDLKSRVQIADTNILDIDEDATVTCLRSTGNNGKLPGFSRVGTPYEQGNVKLQKDDEHIYVMKAAAEAIYMQFEWPGGMYYVSDGHGLYRASGGCKFEYRLANTDDPWKAMNLGDNDSIFDTLQPYFQNLDNPDWTPTPADRQSYTSKSGVWFIYDDPTTQHVRKIAKFTFPNGEGQYEIRLTGTDDDSEKFVRAPTISTIYEVNDGPITTLAGVSLLGVKFRANEQLSNQEPLLKILALGIEVEKLESSGTGYTDNPASLAYGLMRKDYLGLGLLLENSEFDKTGSFTDLADTCNETVTYKTDPGGKTTTRKRHTCNLVLDTSAPARDWLQHILVPARANLYSAEGQLRVFREETRSSDRTFESRPGQTNRYNVLKTDGGQPMIDVVEVPASEQYNAVYVRFIDKDDNYRQRTKRIALSDSVGTTIPEDRYDIFAPAVNNEAEAIELGQFLLNKFNYSTHLLTLGVGWPDLDLVPGERITVYNSDFQWSGDVMDFTVLGCAMSRGGEGVVVGREYNSSIYTASSVLPRNPSYNTNTIKSITLRDGSTEIKTPWYSLFPKVYLSQVNAKVVKTTNA